MAVYVISGIFRNENIVKNKCEESDDMIGIYQNRKNELVGISCRPLGRSIKDKVSRFDTESQLFLFLINPSPKLILISTLAIGGAYYCQPGWQFGHMTKSNVDFLLFFSCIFFLLFFFLLELLKETTNQILFKRIIIN